MYDIFEAALESAGITEGCRDPLIDRGDGVVALVHPVQQAPKTNLFRIFVPVLGRLLAEHNTRWPDYQFRLRAAVHAGEVHYDPRGCFGEALDTVFRLLEAPEVKYRLAKGAAQLVLVVSDDIYRSVVRHGYDGVDHRGYRRVVRVRVGSHWYGGWVCVPEEGETPLPAGVPPDGTEPVPGGRPSPRRRPSGSACAAPRAGQLTDVQRTP